MASSQAQYSIKLPQNPKGKTSKYGATVVNSTCDKGVNKDDNRVMGKRARDHSKLIIRTLRNQVHMLRQIELRIKSKSQITNCKGKSDVRKEQCKLGKSQYPEAAYG